MKYIITESQYKLITEQNSSPCRSEFEKKISKSVKSIFQKTIDTILDPHKTEWNGNREKYVKILKLIGKSESDISKTLDMKFVYHEDGSWSRINKLNTNYSDLSVLVSDILEDEGEDLCELSKRYDDGDKSFLNDLSQVMSLDPERYYNDYIKPNEEKYIKNNTKNSAKGDAAEVKVIEYVKSLGGKLIYQSTEGSPIDTNLGIDLIMISPENVLMKIQVKTVNSIIQISQTPCEKNSELEFKNKKRSGGYLLYTYSGIKLRPENINYVAYVFNNKIVICRKYSPVTVKDKKCIDISSDTFPSSPNKGYFVVDHESVIYNNI